MGSHSFCSVSSKENSATVNLNFASNLTDLLWNGMSLPIT